MANRVSGPLTKRPASRIPKQPAGRNSPRSRRLPAAARSTVCDASPRQKLDVSVQYRRFDQRLGPIPKVDGATSFAAPDRQRNLAPAVPRLIRRSCAELLSEQLDGGRRGLTSGLLERSIRQRPATCPSHCPARSAGHLTERRYLGPVHVDDHVVCDIVHNSQLPILASAGRGSAPAGSYPRPNGSVARFSRLSPPTRPVRSAVRSTSSRRARPRCWMPMFARRSTAQQVISALADVVDRLTGGASCRSQDTPHPVWQDERRLKCGPCCLIQECSRAGQALPQQNAPVAALLCQSSPIRNRRLPPRFHPRNLPLHAAVDALT